MIIKLYKMKLTIKQKRKIAANKLYLTVERLKLLKNIEFDYSTFVTTFNKEKNCGTVCCVAGYYPQWFVGTKLYYNLFGQLDTKDNSCSIRHTLKKYHKLDNEVISNLFYGDDWAGMPKAQNDVKSSLKQVITLFEQMADLIIMEQLDEYLL